MNVLEVLEDQEVDDTPVVIERTKRVCMSTHEKHKIHTLSMEFNNEVFEKLTPINTTIVHRLTATNIGAGIMKIPSRFAARLTIQKQSMLGVRLNSGFAKTVVSYNTSSDGRIVLSKNSWSKFVARGSLEANKHIIFFFKTTSQPHITLKMVVCKI